MYKVFCDFDETISIHDVGSDILRKYGTERAFNVWEDFDAGIKTAAECLHIACETVKDVPYDALHALILEQQIRQGFIEFAQFCIENAIELRIVSDGFSLYISKILQKYSLSYIPIWTNTIELNEKGAFDIAFDHTHQDCRRCASCKCSGIQASSHDADTIIYIGDGYSDHCPASNYADIVFARKDLLKECKKQKIECYPFDDFYEVQSILHSLLSAKEIS